MTRLLYILLIPLLLAASAFGADYYLDAVDGNDSDPGTQVEPWKTISKAQSIATAGDTVYLMTGNYGDFDIAEVSRADWITYIAYTGETPVFTRIYSSYHAGDALEFYLRFEGITVEPSGVDAVNIYKASYLKFIDMILIGPGYTYPYFDARSAMSKAFAFRESDNIEIDGCHIYGTGDSFAVTWPGCASATVTTADSNNFGTGFVYGIYTEQPCPTFTVTNNHIEGCDVGILLYNATNSTISGNHIENLTSDGIEISSCENTGVERTVFDDNHIHDLVTFISADGNDVLLGSHNDCIQLFGKYAETWLNYINITVSNNIMHDSEDQGLFFRTGEDSNDWLIENNLIYNIPSGGNTAIAVRLRSAENIVFRNNTVDGSVWFDPEFGVTEVKELTGNTIRLLDLFTEIGTVITYENYNIINTLWVTSDDHVLGPNSVELDDLPVFNALFVDQASNDYTLISDSMAIGFTNSAYATSTDILGVSRDASPDAGAYEYVSAGGNNPPVLAPIGDKAVDENKLLAFTISATDSDGGDTLTYSAVGLPTGATLGSSSGDFAWTPTYYQSGEYSVQFRVYDGTEYDTEDITITVTNRLQYLLARLFE